MRRHRSVAFGVAALMALGLGVFALLRHRYFLTGTFDLGFYVQDVWLAAHGHSTQTIVQGNLLADHFSPVLYLLAPVTWWSTAEGLLIVQAVFLGLGVIPSFEIGLFHGGIRRAWLAVVWYALSVGIWFGALYDFHPLALAVPLLLWLMLFTDRGDHWGKVLAVALPLATVREDVMALAGLVLLIGAWRHRRRGYLIMGLALVAVGIWYVLAGASVFGDSGFRFWYRYDGYRDLTGSPLAQLFGAIGLAFTRVVQPHAVITLVCLLLPFLVVGPFFGWSRSWPGLLLLLTNIVSTYVPVATIYFQYALPVVPFLIWGSAAGWSRIEFHRLDLSAVAVAASVVIFLVLGPIIFPGTGVRDRYLSEIVRFEGRSAIAAGLPAIPTGESVAASGYLLPHLAERTEAFDFPLPMVCGGGRGGYVPRTGRADWVVIEAHETDEWALKLRAWGYQLIQRSDWVSVWRYEAGSFQSVGCGPLMRSA